MTRPEFGVGRVLINRLVVEAGGVTWSYFFAPFVRVIRGPHSGYLDKIVRPLWFRTNGPTRMQISR